MKQFLKKIRADFILTSLLSILLGIAIMVWKESAMEAFVMFLAIIVICIGFVQIAGFILRPKDGGNMVALAAGILIMVVGMWAIFLPEQVLAWISVIFGVLLLVHSGRSLKEAFDMKKRRYNYWWVAVILSVIGILLGILLILKKMLVWNWIAVVIGIALIFNGVANLWVINRANKSEKQFTQNDVIDVDVREP